jgi:hypothetical protein
MVLHFLGQNAVIVLFCLLFILSENLLTMVESINIIEFTKWYGICSFLHLSLKNLTWHVRFYKGVIMALEISEKPLFIYLSYIRVAFDDTERLKRELNKLLLHPSITKDIVVNVTGCKILTSPELGALAKFAKTLARTSRFVRIIPNAQIYKTMVSMNMHHIENMHIYENKEAFIEQIKNAAFNDGERMPTAKQPQEIAIEQVS